MPAVCKQCAPTLWVLVLLILILAACGESATPPPPAPPTADNARLSNAALLDKAVSNMQALQSYAVEFNSESHSPDSLGVKVWVITGTIQAQAKDGSGVPTRHLVADAAKLSSPLWPEAKRLSVWISTDALPAIRQMRLEGEIPLVPDPTVAENDATTFTYIWQWRRLNEDLGVLPTPLPETRETL